MKWLTRYIILFVLVCCRGTMLAEGMTVESCSPRDSSYVLRSPDADFLEKYRKDENFNYDRSALTAPSLWDWIKHWILERLFRIKLSDTSSRVMDFVLYAFVILFVGMLIFWIIKHRKSLIFRKGGDRLFAEDMVEYNGEQDGDTFTRMLQKAEQERDYTLAVRISYSGLLQVLDKKQVIRWEASKTNRDYVYEIRNQEWSRAFENLSRIFDYVCYGEFSVDEEVYRNIRQSFDDFRKEVEK